MKFLFLNFYFSIYFTVIIWEINFHAKAFPFLIRRSSNKPNADLTKIYVLYKRVPSNQKFKQNDLNDNVEISRIESQESIPILNQKQLIEESEKEKRYSNNLASFYQILQQKSDLHSPLITQNERKHFEKLLRFNYKSDPINYLKKLIKNYEIPLYIELNEDEDILINEEYRQRMIY